MVAPGVSVVMATCCGVVKKPRFTLNAMSSMNPANEALFAEPNPMPLKAGLNAVWGRVGDPRLPLVPASDETTRLVEEALQGALQA